MIDTFIHKLDEISTNAKRTNGNVLLLVLCHGLGTHELALGGSKSRDTLSVPQLQDVLERRRDVPVCLVTTACLSGGWTISPNINTTTTSDDADSLFASLPWPASESVGQFSGSIFAEDVIASLTSDEKDQEAAGQLRTRTYVEFCNSVSRSCQSRYRPWSKHLFTFSSEDDYKWSLPWDESAATPIVYFERHWSELQTQPCGGGSEEAKNNMDPSPSSLRRIQEMVRLWRRTCPGDENAGTWHLVNAFMNRCIKTGQLTAVTTEDDIQDSDSNNESYDSDYNLADIIDYRVNLAQLAEFILYDIGLPRPGGKTCLSWNSHAWETGIAANTDLYGFTDIFDLRRKTGRLHTQMVALDFTSRLLPHPQQGPEFPRFFRYLSAAVVEARLTSEAEHERVFTAMLERIDKAHKFYEEKARANPEVQSKFEKHFGRVLR